MIRRWALLASAALLTGTAAQAQEAGSECAADPQAVAGWAGVWIAEGLMADINGRPAAGDPSEAQTMKLIGLGAPWNEAGWAKLEAAFSRGFANRTFNAGWGFPLMMSAPSPLKFIIAPKETAIVSQYREIRYVYTDGKPLPPEDERWPTLWGYSMGCWQGDTLAIETVDIKYTPEFAYVTPPLSDQARVVERLRMTGPDRIESDITITDPLMLEAPWNVHMVYLRHPVLDRLVHEGDIFENDRIVAVEGGATIAPADAGPARTVQAPPAMSLSEAELERVAGEYAVDGAPLAIAFERRGSRLFYRVDPVLPGFMPLHASDALSFSSRIIPWTFRFTAAGGGEIAGLTATAPNGSTLTARRKAR